MNPEEKELLEKTYEMVEENNHILKSIRRANRWSAFFRIFYWIIIIGASIGVFYFLQPYVDTVFNAYQTLQGNLTKIVK